MARHEQMHSGGQKGIIMVIFNQCPPLIFISIDWYFTYRFWPFGLCAWLCGLIFIDRVHPDKAKDTMNQSVELLKREKIKLWVFPEGESSQSLMGF
jgi:1-acyl-sn-glycerol-3-phosphate acyltransferase